MPLRIGFDMDGVIADFSSAFHDVEERLFGPGPGMGAGQPEKEEEAQTTPAEPDDAGNDAAARPAEEFRNARETRRRRDSIWKAIQATPDFWGTLQPIDPDAVRRIHALML